MKRFPVLLIVLLLMGCAPGTAPAPEDSVLPSQPSPLYRSGSTLEAATGGALRCCPLGESAGTGLRSLPGGLLLWARRGEGTVCTLLTGEDAMPQAELTLPFFLTSLHPWRDGFSCYDPNSREILTVDGELQIAGRIPVPEEAAGAPLLSRDGSQLFYAAGGSLWALDTTSGIRRVLRRSDSGELTLTALVAEDRILQCTLTRQGEQTLFLQTDTGTAVAQLSGKAWVATRENRFYALLPGGSHPLSVYGTVGEPPQSLIFPDARTEGVFLPELQGAVGVHPEPGSITLSYYDLATGLRISTVTFAARGAEQVVADGEGNIWLLCQLEGGPTLLRWDPDQSPVRESQVYTSPYAPQPEEEGLALCREAAGKIQQKFPVALVLTHEDGPQTRELRLEFEHQSPVLLRELTALEQELSRYPAEFLAGLARHFGSVPICLVRSFTHLSPKASPDPVCQGLYWDGFQPWILLTPGQDLGRTLSHALCHLADTVVLADSGAYDTWDRLNPTGFQYDCDYEANQSRNSTAYLQPGSRWFVDMYAMSYPMEDRARILESAMVPGNRELFQGRELQAKLRQLTTGLREAFCLEEAPYALPWEQYLTQ